VKKLISIVFFVFCGKVIAGNLKQPLPHIFYINVPVTVGEQVINTAGQLRIPRGATEKVPAVLILHSSSGVDSTGAFYAKKLNKQGIATFELDLWGGRGLSGGSAGRPETPHETLPDVFSALAFLGTHPAIDTENIGVLGFSWGGVLSLLTANEAVMQVSGLPFRFKGHIAHYPVCWVYNNVPGFELSGLTGADVLIQSGELDDYDLPTTCPTMVENLSETDRENVEVNMYANAYHAWDRLEPEWIVQDPFAHLGAGGQVTLSPNKRIARKSRKEVLSFFEEIFFDTED